MANEGFTFFQDIKKIMRPLNKDGNIQGITEYYGSNVFNEKAMIEKLSSADVEKISSIVKNGGKIDQALASRIAEAVRIWAIEKGATHYCHWFQPQTGSTAEKHDAFLWFDKSGLPIERFTGPELLQSEPDASSFPSGGMRSTFEARGYTGWDPASPMFILEKDNGKTLYIPSVFISYHGESLDFKTPLLRSLEVLSKHATRTLHLLGQTNVANITNTIGAEQEFFVVHKSLALSRLDLKLSGRSVFGKRPAKGQELEDHYFGNIPNRVQAFMSELELELYKLGVPLKTRHNEVAPGQFEIAPIFEGANIASDHNQLVMKVMKSIALRHDLVVLLHEKPFAGVNGSGKHVNWSICDSRGRNLLDPGSTPHENLVFLTFLSAILYGIYHHADVLRASIASAGNDHRLGANEAPPAIISVFLGNTLDKILTAIGEGHDGNINAEKIMIDLGVAHLQDVAKDNTDRNRTSPFAFTGNKFEFRAVGSSAPISYPTAILNTAVAGALEALNKMIEEKIKSAGGEVISNNDLFVIIKSIIGKTKNIRFEGNGYSNEWKDEAAKRGLSNLLNTPAALCVLADKNQTQFLVDCGVFSAEDISSRLVIQRERYIKQCLIEVNCAVEMVATQILPASMKYLKLLLKNTKISAELSITNPAKELAEECAALVSRVQTTFKNLKNTLSKLPEDSHHNVEEITFFVSDKLLPKLDLLREAVDSLEAFMPRDMWPIIPYSDMLFGME